MLGESTCCSDGASLLSPPQAETPEPCWPGVSSSLDFPRRAADILYGAHAHHLTPLRARARDTLNKETNDA